MKPLRKLHTDSHYPLKLRYLDSNKNPIPLAGYSAKMVIRKSMAGPALITKEANIDTATSTINFVVEPSDTESILGEDSAGTFLIGAVMTGPEGQITTLFQSTIEIVENIVRT